MEDTHTFIRDEANSMCHQWARVTARLLDIIILACLQDSVACEVYDARDEFRTIVSRFRAARIENEGVDIKGKLKQLCNDFEGYLDIPPRGRVDLESFVAL